MNAKFNVTRNGKKRKDDKRNIHQVQTRKVPETGTEQAKKAAGALPLQWEADKLQELIQRFIQSGDTIPHDAFYDGFREMEERLDKLRDYLQRRWIDAGNTVSQVKI
jgi:hypothetical protein